MRSLPEWKRCAGVWLSFLDAYEAGLWIFFVTATEVVAVPRPVLHLEDERLHREDGPAVHWPDGARYWFWRGVQVDRQVVEQPGSLTVEQIRDTVNVEVRRVMIDRYGIDRYMRDAGGFVTDHVHEPPIAGLLDARVWLLPQDDDEDLVYVECVNSTPEPDGELKRYFLRVPPRFRKALPAVAWTFGETSDSYSPKVET